MYLVSSIKIVNCSNLASYLNNALAENRSLIVGRSAFPSLADAGQLLGFGQVVAAEDDPALIGDDNASAVRSGSEEILGLETKSCIDVQKN